MVQGFTDRVYQAFVLQLTGDQMALMSKYVENLRAWSDRVRLISRGDQQHIWDRHILDCLSVISLLPNTGPVLDFGSGAGLPGIPIAIVEPTLSVHLLESARMKTLFLAHTVTQLQVENVTVHHARSETLTQDTENLGIYECITARAVASLPVLWESAKRLLSPTGKLIVFKGANPLDEFGSRLPVDVEFSVTDMDPSLAKRERSFVMLSHVSRET